MEIDIGVVVVGRAVYIIVEGPRNVITVLLSFSSIDTILFDIDINNMFLGMVRTTLYGVATSRVNVLLLYDTFAI